MTDECPICFEPLSNTTTRVVTECCNNTLHLECLRECKYKCPLCRSETIQNGYVSLAVVPEIVMVVGETARYKTIFYYCAIVLLMVTYLYTFIVHLIIYGDDTSPPPAP